MKYLHTFENHEEMNEGLKNWLSTFLILAGLGLVPPSIAHGQNKKQQKEFVDNLDQGKIDGALFVDYLNKLNTGLFQKSLSSELPSLFDKFKEQNPNIKSSYDNIRKYVNKSGKQYMFNQAYIEHDYSGVDITKFHPDNWLTDMGNMIEDSKEPSINNWISDYEKLTTTEIGIITINKLPEDKSIEDYALDQFRRIGVGKEGVNNGVLIVLSKEDRKWNITTGYGMEGFLPDVTCSEIGREQIVPHFKEKDYYGGIMAALEQIKSVIGSDLLEIRREAIAKKKAYDDQKSAEFWNNFWQITLQGLMVALLIAIFAYGYYKRMKKIKEMKEMKENIDKILANIEGLKSKIPSNVGIVGSKSLQASYDECKKYFNSIVIQTPKNTAEFKEEIELTYSSMYSLFRNYKSKYDEISKFKSAASGVQDIESSAYTTIEKAVRDAKKISDYGYDAGPIPNKSEIESLSVMIPQIISLLNTDIDSAVSLYKKYTSGISSIIQKASGVATTLGSIENTISRVKNWESEVDRLMSKFKTAGGDKSELNDLIDKFKNKLSVTKDWFELEKALDSVINFMNDVIEEYEAEIRRKEEERRRREEERRRRRKEEERRRSSYSSYSSSSSSSSSFGGFGGGSSGGGGASGSW